MVGLDHVRTIEGRDMNGLRGEDEFTMTGHSQGDGQSIRGAQPNLGAASVCTEVCVWSVVGGAPGDVRL